MRWLGLHLACLCSIAFQCPSAQASPQLMSEGYSVVNETPLTKSQISELIIKRAKSGDANAQYNLGGNAGLLPPDEREWLRWTTEAANGGLLEAQMALFTFFAYGAKQDVVEAMKWAIITRSDADKMFRPQLTDAQFDEAKGRASHFLSSK